MSKKQHDYYYSYTSPPSTCPFPSSSQASAATPSAPSIEEVTSNSDMPSPPGYNEAIQSMDSTMPFSVPPANKPEFEGFIRDDSIPSFNPSSPSSSTVPADTSSSFPLPSPSNNNIPTDTISRSILTTGDYDDPYLDEEQYQDQHSQPLLRDPFQGRPPPPNYSVYRAKYEIQSSGILSRDIHLNNDGEALAQFLHQHNNAPEMKVKFHGYHEETYYRTRNTRDEEGNWREEREPVTKRVDDFQFDIDCSNMVSPECRGLYVLPDPKTGQVKTVRELCDDYVHESNNLKELRLTKVIDWDYAQLTRAFTSAIRAYGYYHSVDISYEMKNYKVTIKTNSTLSRMSDHKAVRFFFFITCLWIIAWPILWLCKKQFGHTSLKSEWAMKVTEQQWYEEHIHEVLGQIYRTPRYANVPFIL
ncbi:uncharacterized protein BX664DRAFT_329424 [Halteromyces radiatus]|uniref:uncharacterized protein n=1 Tax=Halteromyces radiatus TaxID=101107 RepID=UPI002220B035|nr:uncharacterized protein BX664DRAFT_329424 [Halteromyces radiatus]KAI8093313.1 hypothetical protein BX664DRAFT_329424 [Halteromyces radiatus]